MTPKAEILPCLADPKINCLVTPFYQDFADRGDYNGWATLIDCHENHCGEIFRQSTFKWNPQCRGMSARGGGGATRGSKSAPLRISTARRFAFDSDVRVPLHHGPRHVPGQSHARHPRSVQTR